MKTTITNLLLGCASVFVANASLAQVNDTLTIDHNNVSALITSGGHMFMDESSSTAAYEVPQSSGNHTIFNMSAWFGALDPNNQLKLAHNKFGYGTISAGPMADSIFYDSSVYLNQYASSIWRVTRAEIQNHIANLGQPGYIIPPSIIDWPGEGDVSLGVANELAPYVDVNGDWMYNPADGDYPDIRGDMAVYTIMNDHHTDTSIMDMSMGIEIHLMVYQYLDGSYLDNTTFLNYRVYNRSGVDYADYHQSLYADFDIGNGQDDFIGCDSVNHVMYGYNGDAFDEGQGGSLGYGANPPCQGAVCLSHDMIGFNYFTSAAPYPYSDPNSPFEYWNFMNGLWANGEPLVYGGAGYASSNGATNIPTNFAFSGNPNDPNAWSEFHTGAGMSSNPPGDRRGVMSIEHQYLAAGASICSDFALIFDNSGTNLDNVQNVIDLAGQLRNDYSAQNGYPCFSPQFNAVAELPVSVEFSMYPNPSSGDVTIELPQIEDEIRIEVLDMSGRVVLSDSHRYTDRIQIHLNDASGIYLVKTSVGSNSSVQRLVCH